MSAEIKTALLSDFRVLTGDRLSVTLDGLPLDDEERLLEFGLAGLEVSLKIIRDSAFAHSQNVKDVDEVIGVVLELSRLREQVLGPKQISEYVQKTFTSVPLFSTEFRRAFVIADSNNFKSPIGDGFHTFEIILFYACLYHVRERLTAGILLKILRGMKSAIQPHPADSPYTEDEDRFMDNVFEAFLTPPTAYIPEMKSKISAILRNSAKFDPSEVTAGRLLLLKAAKSSAKAIQAFGMRYLGGYALFTSAVVAENAVYALTSYFQKFASIPGRYTKPTPWTDHLVETIRKCELVTQLCAHVMQNPKSPVRDPQIDILKKSIQTSPQKLVSPKSGLGISKTPIVLSPQTSLRVTASPSSPKRANIEWRSVDSAITLCGDPPPAQATPVEASAVDVAKAVVSKPVVTAVTAPVVEPSKPSAKVEPNETRSVTKIVEPVLEVPAPIAPVIIPHVEAVPVEAVRRPSVVAGMIVRKKTSAMLTQTVSAPVVISSSSPPVEPKTQYFDISNVSPISAINQSQAESYISQAFARTHFGIGSISNNVDPYDVPGSPKSPRSPTLPGQLFDSVLRLPATSEAAQPKQVAGVITRLPRTPNQDSASRSSRLASLPVVEVEDEGTAWLHSPRKSPTRRVGDEYFESLDNTRDLVYRSLVNAGMSPDRSKRVARDFLDEDPKNIEAVRRCVVLGRNETASPPTLKESMSRLDSLMTRAEATVKDGRKLREVKAVMAEIRDLARDSHIKYTTSPKRSVN